MAALEPRCILLPDDLFVLHLSSMCHFTVFNQLLFHAMGESTSPTHNMCDNSPAANTEEENTCSSWML